MEPREYGRTAAVEDGHFWFREARLIWQGLLHRAGRDSPAPDRRPPPAGRPAPEDSGSPLVVLDAGCGTGGSLRAIEANPALLELGRGGSREGGGARAPRLVGLDLSPLALEWARGRTRSPLTRGSIGSLPFRDGSFDLVLCTDVLYHADVRDDLAALRELRRVLQARGILCVNVPAFDPLRSAHDRAMHTARRYTRGRLRGLLLAAGFAPSRVIYWNGILFLPAAVLRLLRKQGGVRSEIGLPPLGLNAILWLLARCDAAMALWGLLPFGLSVAALARREG